MSPAVIPPAVPAGVQQAREYASSGALPIFRLAGWERRFPWLVQGITGRGATDFDLGVFGATPAGELQRRWRALREAVRMPRAVHAHQVHRARLVQHGPGPAGMLLVDGADGHCTAAAGTLLTVSVADCVPVYLVAPAARGVALLHAGWRGVAEGILEAGLEFARDEWRVRPPDLVVHFGPAICGACYEVGPEVPEGLGLGNAVDGRSPRCHVDLRAVLAGRALAAGVPASATSSSAHCTRCGDGSFYSHRGGDAGRQMAFLGIREDAA